MHCGPTVCGDGDDIVLGVAGAAGDEPDGARQEGDRALESRVEQAFGVEQAAQPLDAGQQLTESDGAESR